MEQDLSSQQRLSATCVQCGETRRFEIVDTGEAPTEAVYECPECEHRIVLDLEPTIASGGMVAGEEIKGDLP